MIYVGALKTAFQGVSMNYAIECIEVVGQVRRHRFSNALDLNILPLFVTSTASVNRS